MIGTLGLLVDDGIEQFVVYGAFLVGMVYICLLYTSPSPRDA